MKSIHPSSQKKLAQGADRKPSHIMAHRTFHEGGREQTHETPASIVTSVQNDLIDTRLSQLPDPSNELLTYYRRKVETLTEDHEHIQRRLDQIADAIGNQETLTWEVRQREAEIAELQRALSDMQVYLFQEREHVLRMYAENDRLKIRELDDRRKIQHLLQLSGLGQAEVTYFLRDSGTVPGQSGSSHMASEQYAQSVTVGDDVDKSDECGDRKRNCVSGLIVQPVIPPIPVQGTLELTASGKNIRRPATGGPTSHCSRESDGREHNSAGRFVSSSEHEAALREIEMTKATLRSLRTQLTEQARTAREQIDALLDERSAMQEEMDALRKRNEDRFRHAAEQLKRCQDLLYDSTKEFLAQRNQFRQSEKLWITEKDQLLSQLESRRIALAKFPSLSKQNLHSNAQNVPQPGTIVDTGTTLESKAWSQVISHLSAKKEEKLSQTIANLEEQLDQQQKLSDMYREQVIQLEDELVRYREEALMSKDVLKEHTGKLNERLQTMNNRYRELERRRQLEMEGYRTDITALRKKLREVEKQLLKLTLGLTDGLDTSSYSKNMDLAILEQVKSSATRSMHLMNELKSLKLKMYALEDELRRI